MGIFDWSFHPNNFAVETNFALCTSVTSDTQSLRSSTECSDEVCILSHYMAQMHDTPNRGGYFKNPHLAH